MCCINVNSFLRGVLVLIACKTPDLLLLPFITQGLLIFLLHVVRNSDVGAEIHHKLLKWRFERSVNRVHEKSSTSISRSEQKRSAESRDEVENIPNSHWLLCACNITLCTSTEATESLEWLGLTTGRTFVGRFSSVFLGKNAKRLLYTTNKDVS